MAKIPDLSAGETTMLINALVTQRAVFERAKRAGDADVAEVYVKKIAALDVLKTKFEGALL